MGTQPPRARDLMERSKARNRSYGGCGPFFMRCGDSFQKNAVYMHQGKKKIQKRCP